MRTTILFLSANPNNTTHLRLDYEVREIREGLQRAKLRDRFVLEQRWAVRHADIRRALLECEPRIVHFSGHSDGDQGIILENDENQTSLVTAEALKDLFQLFPQIECVVLNTCYSELQASAISEVVRYVIGMPPEVLDDAAIQFSIGFYDAIGAGKSVNFAYELGCSAIKMSGTSSHSRPILKIGRVNPEKDPFIQTGHKLEKVTKWPILQADDFSNAEVTSWPLGNFTGNMWETKEYHIVEGRYKTVLQLGKNRVAEEAWCHPGIALIGDFYTVIKARLLSGPADFVEYGIIFRLRHENKFYRFAIREEDRSYCFSFYDGSHTAVINWIKTQLINPGEFNELGLLAEGNHFIFFINGQYVSEAEDNFIESGRVGLTVRISDSYEIFVLEFDDFEIRTP